VLVLAGLVLIAFAAWLHHGARAASPRWRRVALPLALACVAAAVAVGPLAGGTLFASAGAAPPTAASGAN